MSSGIVVPKEVDDTFQQLKAQHLYRYISFKVSDDRTKIEVDKTVKESSIEEFIEQLPSNAPRYFVFDCPYVSKTGANSTRLIFIGWSPDSGHVTSKMVFASSKDAVKKRCPGCVELQANDLTDITKELLLDKAVNGR
jgi:cofilin